MKISKVIAFGLMALAVTAGIIKNFSQLGGWDLGLLIVFAVGCWLEFYKEFD